MVRIRFGIELSMDEAGRSAYRYTSEHFYRAMHYSAKGGLAIACRLSVRLSVCPSVTLVDHDHIGWKSWNLTVRTISPTSSLFVAQRSSIHLLPGEHGEIFGRLEAAHAYAIVVVKHTRVA